MLRSVLGKVIHDQWRWIVGMSALAGLLAAFYVALYPSVGAASEIQSLMDSMPPPMRAIFAPQGMNLATPEGYLNIELFSFVAPLFVLIFAVSVGSAATAGEEERGTIDLLLANPIPRWRIVAEKGAGLLAGSIVLGIGLWSGVAAGVVIGAIKLDLWRVAGALVSNGLLGLVFGAIAMALGSASGRRLVSLGVAMALALLAYFLNVMSPLVEGLKPWRVLSPFYHYNSYDPLNSGLQLDHVGVLVALCVVLLIAATIAFERRDLAA